MLSAVIIDDEQFCIDDLTYQIRKLGLHVSVIASADSCELGIEIIKEHHPDLVFLDIAMPDMSCFEMLEQLTEIDFNLIVMTSIDKYIVDAIKASAIDFLIKPVRREELLEMINRILESKVIPEIKQLNFLREQLELYK